MIQKIYHNGYEFQIDSKYMNRRFKGGGSAKMPAVQPTPAVPVAVQTDVVEDEAMKKVRRRSGYEKTIITGDLESSNSGKLTTLG